MKVSEIMSILQEEMKTAVVATVDITGMPHARYVNIGVANEEGVFFMTHPKTNFYQQLQDHPHIAITGMKEEGYLIQVIRIEGEVRELGKEKLEKVLANNSYVKQVYPNQEEQSAVHVFQLYRGEGFYHSLTQGHKYIFKIGK